MASVKAFLTVGSVVLPLFGWCSAADAQGARVGMLECDVAAGTGFVVTSSKALTCMFRPDSGAPPEMYVGTVSRFGLDIGFTAPGKLAWGVLVATNIPAPGSLQGSYGGVGGGATIGVGATANLLTGGNGGTVSLQPLSISGQTGLNVTAGIGQIALQYVPPPRPRMRKYKHRRYRHR